MKIYETPSVVSLKLGREIDDVGQIAFVVRAAFVKGFHEGALTVDPHRHWQPGVPQDGCTIQREYYGFNCEEK